MTDARQPLLQDPSADLESPPSREEEKPQADVSYGTLEEKSETRSSYIPGSIYRKVYELQGKLNQDPFSLPEEKRDESGARRHGNICEVGTSLSVLCINFLCIGIGLIGAKVDDRNKNVWQGVIWVGLVWLVMNTAFGLVSKSIAARAEPCLRKSRNFFFAKKIAPKLELDDKQICQDILATTNRQWLYSNSGDLLRTRINLVAGQMNSYENELKTVIAEALPTMNFSQSDSNSEKPVPPLIDLTLGYLDVPAAVEEAVIFKTPRR